MKALTGPLAMIALSVLVGSTTLSVRIRSDGHPCAGAAAICLDRHLLQVCVAGVRWEWRLRSDPPADRRRSFVW